jgi:two-component system, OmpR family, sensor kinase
VNDPITMRADARTSRRAPRPLRFLRRLSDRTPLRTKLITAVLGLVIIALAAIGVASTYKLHTYLTTQRDTDLESVIDQFNATNALPQNVDPGFASPTRSDIVLGLQQPGSQLSWSSTPLPGMGGQNPLPQLPTSSNWAGSNGNSVPQTYPAQSGPDSWRVMAETVQITDQNTGQTSTGTLVAAIDVGNLTGATHELEFYDLTVGGAIVVVLAAVGVAIVQTNLRPLNDIEMTAGEIARGHLNHRVPERDPRTEIGSLGRSLNIMLSQIETAFHAQEQSERAAHQSEERMRRFIADASHELRTPLTTIRGFAEYYRQRGGIASRTEGGFTATANGSSGQGLAPEDLDRIMHRLEAEASRMGVLVEDLLLLARLDQQRPLNIQPVDLLTLAADAVQDARMVARDRPIDLIVAPGAAYLVDGDEARLRQVIGNLVNNALAHTPAGTPVRVRIGSGTLTPPSALSPLSPPSPPSLPSPDSAGAREPVPAVVLDVEDDGPGMTPEQAQRVFERFYRADQARTRTSGGTGLGLSIVASLVAAHGGTVSVRTAPGEGADFQVKLPLSPEAQGYDEDLDSAEPPD